MQIAPDLQGEVRRRDHHAGRAVPFADAVAGGRCRERTPRVVVVPNDAGDVALFRDQAVARGHERHAPGCAAVLHRGEWDAAQSHAPNHVVGLGFAVGAAHGDIDVVPGQPGVGERPAHRLLGERLILTVKATECGHASADDVDLVVRLRRAHEVAANP